MIKVFKNWKLTCDKLVLDPHFSDGWRLPAFFPIYLAFYKAAIDEFFHEQKKLHHHLSSMMEEQWQHAFCSILCLSLNDTIHKLKRLTGTETNAEILRQLSRDLTSIVDLQLSAMNGCRMFRHASGEYPSWGYCLELAQVEGSTENLILFRRDEEINEEKLLDWVPLSSFYTVKQATIHNVSYTGPSEEVLQVILEVFRDVFEFPLKTN